MLDYLLLSSRTLFVLTWDLPRNLAAEGWRCSVKRLPLMLLCWLLFLVFSLLHLAGFLLDELLFSGYRRVRVHKPLFITGIPRSGTTHLHRVLARDPRFTSLSTWEVLLAPSISERHLYRLLGRLLAPAGKLIIRIRGNLLHDMDKIHRIRLQEPEEDFLLLLWVGHCFLLAFLCPASQKYWDLGRFCTRIPPSRQDRVMRYYRFCLQKHLYYHGEQLTLLSKNPSFTSVLPALRRAFPDANVVACYRPPGEALPSQLSSLRPAMRVLGSGRLGQRVRQGMIEVLHHYYRSILRPDRTEFALISMESLQQDLRETVHALYRRFQLDLSAGFSGALDQLHEQSRNYSSSHRYSLAEFNLTDEAVDKHFADVWPLGDPPGTAEQV